MVYETNSTEKIEKLFDGWEESLIWSALQGVMGKIYVTDRATPLSAMIILGERAKRVTRYAIKKGKSAFDRKRLEAMAGNVPPGYEVKLIDEAVYLQSRREKRACCNMRGKACPGVLKSGYVSQLGRPESVVRGAG